MIPTKTDQIDSTQASVRTLPASYYTHPDILEQEKQRLFFKTWQFVGHAAELSQPGAYKTVSIFNQNIVLVRTKEGNINAFYNVCPHRGHTLVEGNGEKRAFVCPYHAWTFALDGKLLGARGTKTANGVDKSQICLFPVRVELLLDLIFINLDPNAQPLPTVYPGLAEQMVAACPEVSSYQLRFFNEERKFHSSQWNANWKVLIDNFLECYHCETAHPTFSDIMCIPDTIRTIHHNFTHEVTPVSTDPEKWPHPINPDHDVMEAHFWYLFPNTAIGRAAGVPNFYISRFDPLSPDTALRSSLYLMPAELPDPDAPRRIRLRSEWSASTVGAEDRALCESVQRGMHQRGFQQGWYITDPNAHNISEHALRYFHELYLAAMG